MEQNRCNRDVSCKGTPPVVGLNRRHSPGKGFDPELMYVECHRCGRPLIWNQGEASQIIKQSGIDTKKLDAQCLILAEGCPQCAPGEGGYLVRVVRLREDGYSDVRAQGH